MHLNQKFSFQPYIQRRWENLEGKSRPFSTCGQ